MKRYITFVLVAMSLVGLVACSNDNGIAAPDGEAQVALRFESSSMTRADVAGSDDLNENLIKTIDCYFYPANATKDTEAVWYQKFTFGTDGAGINSSASVTDILMPSGEMNAIFGQGTTGKIYAIANYAGGDALPTSGANTTVTALKDMVVTTAWLKDGAFQKQSSFVMDSEMVEITKSEGNTISGTVPLLRTAAKVELTITDVAESAKDAEGNVWVPNITVVEGVVTGANVTMYNARTTASVGGAVQAFNDGTHPELEDYGFSSSTVAGALYKQTNPFYTYPHTWSSSEQEAYLLLVVNWMKQSDHNSTANCYYEIPIGAADNKEILRNHIYQIGINVGTLGSFVQEEPMLLKPSYKVVDWGTGDISAEIKGQRYLVVDKKKIEIFNQTSGFVGYNSSHDVEIIIDKIEYDNYREDNTRYVLLNASGKSYTTDTNSTPATNLNDSNDTHVYADYSATLNTTARTVTVNHSLTNKLMYVPHKIYVTIRHTDNDQFSEQIEFIQYPPIYIIAKPNSKPNSNGGVFVNNGSSTNSNYGGVHGLTGNNKNPNMYVINVTALSASYDGRIGDPRSATINNQLSNGNTTWSNNNTNFLYPESGVTQRRLTYYYPSANNTQDIIAPQFRNASSYGVTNDVNWQNAQNRCATYQEDGYPAGRWRIPTEAEIKFIASLSADHFIPRLFGSSDTSNTYYWTGSGTLFASADKEIVEYNNQTTYVRCVYDEWYWGSEQLTNKTTFTWGDMPR